MAWEAPIYQCRKSRFRTKRVPFGIIRQKCQMNIVHFEGLIQVLERDIGVTESCMNLGKRIRRNVPFLCSCLQNTKQIMSGLSISLSRQYVSAESDGFAVASTQATGIG